MQMPREAFEKTWPPDERAFRQALDRLEDPDYPQAVADSGDLEGALSAIATEIEETVLARQIDLAGEGRTVAHLEISNRRLAGFGVVDPETSAVIEVELVAESVLYALEGLVERSGPLSLTYRRRSEARAMVDLSLPAQDLRTALANRDTGHVLEYLLKDVGSDLLAWVRVGDHDEIARHETPGHSDDFRQFEAFWRAGERDRTDVSKLVSPRPGCMIVPFTSGNRALVASVHRDALLAVFRREDEARIIGSWQRIVGRTGLERGRA